MTKQDKELAKSGKPNSRKFLLSHWAKKVSPNKSLPK